MEVHSIRYNLIWTYQIFPLYLLTETLLGRKPIQVLNSMLLVASISPTHNWFRLKIIIHASSLGDSCHLLHPQIAR